MSQSKLQNFNQRILKKLISTLYKVLLENDSENPKIYNISDDDVFRSIEYTLELMGLGKVEYEDIDFVFALYSMNYSKIKDGIIESDLEIPQISEYTFKIDVNETLYQTTTYKHRLFSYSESNVIPISQKAENDGYFSVYEGNPIDTNVHDSETNDISWNNHSVTKIKSEK